jgi:hypothetical protein
MMRDSTKRLLQAAETGPSRNRAYQHARIKNTTIMIFCLEAALQRLFAALCENFNDLTRSKCTKFGPGPAL